LFFKKGFLKCFNTPVSDSYLKGSKKRYLFYSNPEFRKWYSEIDTSKVGSVNYYKGLGSINPKDAPFYFQNPKEVVYTNPKQEKSKESMELCFGKNANKRKEWMMKNIKENFENREFVYEGKLSIPKFVNDQMIIPDVSSLERAIPSFYDGFKESQRKIIYTVLTKNYKKTIDIEKLSGAVKELTGYHHGAVSLMDTTINLAQGFVGSNNIPLLKNDGEVGTRIEGGKDAAAGRYVQTGAENILRSIYKASDEPLLKRKYEDNTPVDYEHYIPIFPMSLVNGAEGIATGWATNIPCHNPLDIVKWIKKWILGKIKTDPENPKIVLRDNNLGIPEIVPWYRSFGGKIESLGKLKDGTPKGWKSHGFLRKVNKKATDNWWEVTELPVGLWTQNFEKRLQELSSSGGGKRKAILEYRDNSPSVNKVHFKFRVSKNFLPDVSTKNNFDILSSTVKCRVTNMVLLDENKIPKKYSSADEILLEFCPMRLEWYKKRKQNILETLKLSLRLATNKYKFVKAVVDEELNLKKEDNILYEIMENDFKLEKLTISNESNKQPSFDYLLSMQMRSMTLKKLNELKKEKVSLEEKIAETEKVGPKKMWMNDLNEFLEEYNKFLKNRIED